MPPWWYEALGVDLRQVMGLRPQEGGCEKEKSKMPHAELIWLESGVEADQVLPDRREKGSERMRQTQALQAPPTPKKTPRPIIDAINRAPREELGASLGVSFGSSEIG